MATKKSILDNWVGFAVTWFTVIFFTLIIGLGVQWLLFAEAGSTLMSVAMRWPILWIVYFWLGIAAVENMMRILKLR